LAAFFGGLLMLLGVYFSYITDLAVLPVVAGAIIFICGIYLDLGGRAG
jgi:ABC-type Mn2+/Zn2+ transport system permease subunit